MILFEKELTTKTTKELFAPVCPENQIYPRKNMSQKSLSCFRASVVNQLENLFISNIQDNSEFNLYDAQAETRVAFGIPKGSAMEGIEFFVEIAFSRAKRTMESDQTKPDYKTIGVSIRFILEHHVKNQDEPTLESVLESLDGKDRDFILGLNSPDLVQSEFNSMLEKKNKLPIAKKKIVKTKTMRDLRPTVSFSFGSL